VVTELVDLIESGHRDAFDLSIRGVDEFEEFGERRTEGQAAATLVTDLAYASEFTLELLGVCVRRVAVI
jgi:hypothetical protein